jgi:hypothetical protein
MMKLLSAVLFGTVGVASGVAMAHHSFAMFDQDYLVCRSSICPSDHVFHPFADIPHWQPVS